MLTEDLARALDAQGDIPLQAVHPITGKVYFLVSADRYERIRPLLENEPVSHDEQQFMLREAGRRAGWDEPAMDAYDRYDDYQATP
jgi:hypothetical protein